VVGVAPGLAAGVPTEVIEALEAGTPGLTTTQLDALATALTIDVQALRQGQVVPRPSPSVYLRHRGLQDFHDADMAILDGAIAEARALAQLSTLLREPPTTWTGRTSLAPHDRSDAAARDGYRLAGEVRKHLGDPHDRSRPVERAPSRSGTRPRSCSMRPSTLGGRCAQGVPSPTS
jgi:hypothetical protein